MEKIIITEKDAGKRIDKFLAEEFFLYSRGEIVNIIKDGKVRLNGKVVKPSYKLEENDEISIEIETVNEKKLLPNPAIKLDIIAEQKGFLVINKPAGLQVHPSNFQQNNTLTNALISRYPEIENVHDDSADAYLRPGIVHRLDKDTSGVMIIAKNLKTFHELKALFQNRNIIKKYITIVAGKLDEKIGKIEKPLARSAGYSKQLVARKNTKTKIREAVTEYNVVEEFDNCSLLEVMPKTGRMHQIRVHLASIGHQVVGDLIYGEKNLDLKAERQLLHAKSLSFELDGKKYKFESEMPVDFVAFLAKIRQK